MCTQAAQWEHEEAPDDDDLDQGGGDDEFNEDDPGLRKKLGELARCTGTRKRRRRRSCCYRPVQCWQLDRMILQLRHIHLAPMYCGYVVAADKETSLPASIHRHDCRFNTSVTAVEYYGDHSMLPNSA